MGLSPMFKRDKTASFKKSEYKKQNENSKYNICVQDAVDCKYKTADNNQEGLLIIG